MQAVNEVATAEVEMVSVPRKHLAGVLDYLREDEREDYENMREAGERTKGHVWEDVRELLPLLWALPCTCGGVLCEFESFDCRTCGRTAPNCRGAADQWPDDCDDCVAKKIEGGEGR